MAPAIAAILASCQRTPSEVVQSQTATLPAAANAKADATDTATSNFADEAFVLHQMLCVSLATKKGVAAELNLRDDQKTAVANVSDDGMDRAPEFVREVAGSPTDRWMGQLLPKLLPIARDVERQLSDHLDAEQFRRLNQIVYHHDTGAWGTIQIGPLVLLQPAVSNALQLDRAQLDSITDVVSDMKAALSKRGTVDKLFGSDTVVIEYREKAEKHLNAAQLQKWKELKGPPPTSE
jgi:hypothetical protein